MLNDVLSSTVVVAVLIGLMVCLGCIDQSAGLPQARLTAGSGEQYEPGLRPGSTNLSWPGGSRERPPGSAGSMERRNNIGWGFRQPDQVESGSGERHPRFRGFPRPEAGSVLR